MKTLILLIGLLMMASVHAEQNLFSVLVQDTSLVRDVRSEGDNVWIEHGSTAMSILNQKGFVVVVSGPIESKPKRTILSTGSMERSCFTSSVNNNCCQTIHS
jgi:hypothetical protein